MDLMTFRRAWLNHLGVDSNFPRDMGFPERRKVFNWWQYLRTIELNLHTNNIYVSLYSDHNIEKGLWDKLFFDVDGHVDTKVFSWEQYLRNLAKAHINALRLYDYLSSEFSAEPRVYFTGFGFAVYFDFEPVSIDKWSIRQFALEIINKVKAKKVDTAPLGDKRRISRVPYTYNFKMVEENKKPMCIPISIDWDLDTIISESYNPTKFMEVRVQPVKVEIPVYDVDIPEHNTAIVNLDYIDDELILFIYKNAPRITDGRKRLIHFVLVPTFIHKYNMTLQEVHVMCKLFVEKTGADYEDYRSYVESSITRTLRDGWRPWSMDYFLYRCPELKDYIGGDGDGY